MGKDETPPTEEPIGQLIRRAHHMGRTAISDIARHHGISGAQFGALRRLERAPGASSADLARDMTITPQAMHELLGGLEVAELIERQPDPTNRRKRIVSLTSRGLKVLNECTPEVHGVEEEFLARLTPTERDRLARLLLKYLGEKGEHPNGR